VIRRAFCSPRASPILFSFFLPSLSTFFDDKGTPFLVPLGSVFLRFLFYLTAVIFFSTCNARLSLPVSTICSRPLFLTLFSKTLEAESLFTLARDLRISLHKEIAVPCRLYISHTSFFGLLADSLRNFLILSLSSSRCYLGFERNLPYNLQSVMKFFTRLRYGPCFFCLFFGSPPYGPPFLSSL